MGYRANIVTQHRQYGDITFSDYDAFRNFLATEKDKLPIEWIDNSEECFIEIKELEKYIATIPDNNEISSYEHMTNQELAHALRKAIGQSPDEYVTWEWF